MFSRSKFHLFNFRTESYKTSFKRKYSKAASKPLTSDLKGVVGLEIHAQIKTNSKLFSGSLTTFGSPVNCNVSLFDAAIPGTLPTLNKKCVEFGVLAALALNCQINEVSMFDRKHYFYADLPAGYQITQQRAPLARNGILNFPVFNPAKHKVPYKMSSKILQFQLEQDSGKSLHDGELKRSLIDLNRAGIPLIEIVFAPDLSDGEEAAALVKELCLILTRLGVCSCKMEEGALRVDANVSVNKKGEDFGVRTEIKNISSVRGVANAVDFEIKRQKDLLSRGQVIVNETRAWDAISCKTVAMRDKETKQDYRFMPETNLPPLRLNMSHTPKDDQVNVELLKSCLPELPEKTRKDIELNYGLQADLTLKLVGEEELLKMFQDAMKLKSVDPKKVACLITIELMTLVNKGKTSLDDKKFNGSNIGDIANLLTKNVINLVVARKIMEEIALGNTSSPNEIVTNLGLGQIVDVEELQNICNRVIEENPKIVSQYKSGKTKVFPALLGIISKQTNNRAKMDIVTKLLKDSLDKPKS